MRRMLGLLLLLIQLGPVAGAGLCLHAAAQPAEHCATPMEGMAPNEPDRSHHGSSPDCALMAFCAPSAPVVPQAPVHTFSSDLLAATRYSDPPELLPGDPIAPPQPPPIA